MKKNLFLAFSLCCLLASSCAQDSSSSASASDCDGYDCGEHGYCVLNNGEPECLCDTGYIESADRQCILEEGACDDNHNCADGKCLYAPNGNPYCECKEGYTANNSKLICVKNPDDEPPTTTGEPNPDEKTNPEDPETNPPKPTEKPEQTCDGIDCGEHGQCAIESEVAVCLCEEGFIADNVNMVCVSSEGACSDKSHCTNGSCLYDDNNKPYCKCKEGFIADNDTLTCTINKVDNDNNHMFDGYQSLASDYGKDCRKDADCAEGFCDSAIGHKCSRRCQSDDECQQDENYDYYCRRDGRCASKTFTTKWKPFETKTIDGVEYKNVVVFPFGSGECDYTIHYDGKTLKVTECPEYDSSTLSKVGHILTFDKIDDDGTVTISVTGKINHWSCAYAKTPSNNLYSRHSSCLKNKQDCILGTMCANLDSVISFGPVTLTPFAFHRATALTRIDSEEDIPDPTEMTNMAYMFFRNYELAYGDINKWDTSNVEDMNNAFAMPDGEGFCSTSPKFNLPIGNWDTSKVTDMKRMFNCNKSFNQPIGNWDTSKVTDLSLTFNCATHFNQPIGDWDVSKNTSLNKTFAESGFNQDIGKWDVSNVTDMYCLFNANTVFNQDIGNWDVSKVKNLGLSFRYAYAFNQDISRWNTKSATSMKEMFCHTKAFNQDIGNWDVSNVTDMSNTFYDAKVFNQDISKWNVAKATNMNGMFREAAKFNQNIGNWNVAKVKNMTSMFNGAKVFNQDLSNWNVAKVTEYKDMFTNSKMSNENYCKMVKNEAWKKILDSLGLSCQ